MEPVKIKSAKFGHHREGTFIGVGGLRLYYQSWLPPQAPRAILVLVHGLGSHSGSFENLANLLVPYGYGMYAFDMRGHGRSQGQRGYIQTWSEFRQDLDTFLALIDRQISACSRFLVGHSLGAVVILEFLMRSQPSVSQPSVSQPSVSQPSVSQPSVSGAIAMAPALGRVGVPPVKLAIGRVLSNIWPRFSLDTGLEAEAAVQDKTLLQANLEDPLRHTQGTARLATEFLQTVDWIHEHVDLCQFPLLILHGGSDRIALPEGSQQFAEQLPHRDTSCLVYPNTYHDLHQEVNAPQVAADLHQWVEARSDAQQCQILALPQRGDRVIWQAS
ncbi:alpha/beta hydrolase [Synechococcus sp. PCC 7336]|uniref:alpha/beta hydrolase n=1 Tax=Synechococcus sp. PCC 7336 TaxID=195250 RepID=UPI00034B92CF|nr:alpha/beta hydrolase [Synechococcus sp. PCC 7336]